ncbi:TonB-dependent receptor [Pedobacter helvus]|uniref:TonB-dependent receptor n=1 Tax=Pedobacter helvus TaxID=2563444 RepID=A0ABW9JN46_9SPHI|nr:TonB-dependent receptor [Pedobacter ureilyticus]
MMKLVLGLVFLVCMQVSAASFAQKVSISVKNAHLKEVFNLLRKKTGYDFLYNSNELNNSSRVTITADNEDLKSVLDRCLSNQPLIYSIKETTILIKKKPQSAATVQQATVTGKVTDEKGEPLAGASVFVKNQNTTVTTSNDGRYTIRVPNNNAVLVFSFVGYETAERIVLNNKEINISLKTQEVGLNDVVVVGYGTQRKGDLTGSIASISERDLEKVSTVTFDMKLQGRAAGVMVTQTSAEPGGNVSIRVRGSNSVSGDNEPLYVVDGYPLPTLSEASGNGYGQEANPLSGINPDDIESIQILKDASSTAIYGSRGANGVVIITTKRGKEGKASIVFESLTGGNNIINLPEMGTAQQYAQERNDYSISLGQAPPYDGSSARLPLPENAGIGTRWVDHILRTGITQKYQLGINGGTKLSKYNISGNYYTEEGVIVNSKMGRGNVRINLDNTLSDKLTLSTTINLTSIKNNRVQAGGISTNRLADPILLALRANPVVPLTATGTSEYGGNIFGDTDGNFFENPVTLATDKKDIILNEDYFANVKGVYKFNSYFSGVVNAGTTRRYSQRDIYYPRETTALGYQNSGYAFVNKYQSQDYVVEAYLKYNRSFKNKHNLDIIGGTSVQQNVTKSHISSYSNFPDDILTTEALQFATSIYTPRTTKLERTLRSFYLRTNYSFLNRYLFTFSGRADGSSVFAANHKWGYFPSGAFAWKIYNEPFFRSLTPIFSDLKLRASYGLTGSQSIAPLGSLSQIGNANYVSGETLISGTAITSVGNNDLKWEQTRQLNLGLDIALFKNRLKITVDAYEKNTDRLLQTLNIPASSGFKTMIVNMGSVRNKGLEFDVSGDIIKTKGFQWNSSVNVSFNRPTVTDLGGNSEIYGLGPTTAAVFLRSTPLTIIQVGQGLPMYYGLVAERLIQKTDFDGSGNPTFAMFNNEKRPGQWLYKDVNNDGVINALDRQVIGNPNPKAIFGYNNEINYKKFTLNIFFQGVLGNDVMNISKAYLSTGMVHLNKSADWYQNKWTPENPTNNINYTGFGTVQDNLVPGNYYIEDGSYLRLKNVGLGYNLALKKGAIKNLIFNVSATNLLTITNYSGFDPEVGIFGKNNLLPSMDLGSYPRARTVFFGVKCHLK